MLQQPTDMLAHSLVVTGHHSLLSRKGMQCGDARNCLPRPA
jgi:hypothetical protein